MAAAVKPGTKWRFCIASLPFVSDDECRRWTETVVGWEVITGGFANARAKVSDLALKPSEEPPLKN
jgi:hypothetical protein